MPIVSFYKSRVEDLSIKVINVNGMPFDNFKEYMEASDIENIEKNLSNLNINFGLFCKRDIETQLINETWIDIELEIAIKTNDENIKSGLLQMDAKYTQLSYVMRENIKKDEVKFKLNFYRSRWSGPVECSIFLNDKDGNLISHSQQITIYSDGRDGPSLSSGLFSYYKDDFSSNFKLDNRNWKKLAQNLNSQNQLAAFDREKTGSKKIAIWWNTKIKRIEYLSRTPNRFKGRSIDSGIFGLTYLATTIGPFMVYLHEVIIEASDYLNNDSDITDRLSDLTNYDVEAFKNLHQDIRTKIEQLGTFVTYDEFRLLAINLYKEMETVDEKIVNFTKDVCKSDNHFKIFQRGQFALQNAFKSDTWINNNLSSKNTGEE